MPAIRHLGLASLAALGLALAAPAWAQGPSAGLSGIQSVEVRVEAPPADGTPCKLDEQSLRNAVIRGLGPNGPKVGTSALTLRLRVTTLFDAIAAKCYSALELTALTQQQVVIQANKAQMVVGIPLWDGTTLAVSPTAEHLDRASAQIAQVAGKFVADWRASQ
ncbi:MAG: hypothetical protein ACM3N5_09400 [Candidatus Eiseniibacteriota bacterium]